MGYDTVTSAKYRRPNHHYFGGAWAHQIAVPGYLTDSNFCPSNEPSTPQLDVSELKRDVKAAATAGLPGNAETVRDFAVFPPDTTTRIGSQQWSRGVKVNLGKAGRAW